MATRDYDVPRGGPPLRRSLTQTQTRRTGRDDKRERRQSERG